MKIKALIHITATKPDLYGNTYRRGHITNTRTGKSTPGFKANSTGNVSNIFRQLTGAEYGEYSTSEDCTGSARLSSLPDGEYVRPADLARELRKIGFAIPAARARDCQGCL